MSWHLDKTVTVSLISGLVINTGVLVWWASALSSEVQKVAALPAQMVQLERRVLVQETKNEMLLGVLGELKVTIAQVANVVGVIGKEQARRTPIITKAERELFNHLQRGE